MAGKVLRRAIAVQNGESCRRGRPKGAMRDDKAKRGLWMVKRLQLCQGRRRTVWTTSPAVTQVITCRCMEFVVMAGAPSGRSRMTKPTGPRFEPGVSIRSVSKSFFGWCLAFPLFFPLIEAELVLWEAEGCNDRVLCVTRAMQRLDAVRDTCHAVTGCKV